MSQQFANNAASILTGDILAADITLDVRPGDGALFPSLGIDEFFMLTLVSFDANGNEDNWEIVKVTAVTSDTFTIERGQEGTVAQDWPSATVVENRLTAGTADNLARKNELGTAARKNVGTGVNNVPQNSDLNIEDWDLAFSWGNHDVAGYLKNVDWGIITNKPQSAIRWPTWFEIGGKPSAFEPETSGANSWTGNNEFTQPLKAKQFHQGSIHAIGEVSGVATINLADGNYQTISLAGDTTFIFTDPAGPCSCNLFILNAGFGQNIIITLPPVVLESGTQPTQPYAAYILNIFFDGTYYWVSWVSDLARVG